jgi:hypothetical protein
MMKQRQIKLLNKEMLKYYETPEIALHSYITRIITETEKIKFFGTAWARGTHSSSTDIEESIGRLIDSERQLGKVKGEQVSELRMLLKARFIEGEMSPHKYMQDFKNINYAMLLGNPIATATQLADSLFAVYKTNDFKAVIKTLRSSLSKNRIKIDDLGLRDVAEELVSNRPSAEVMRFAFKWSGFSRVDRFGKEAILNGAWHKYSKQVLSEDGLKAFNKKWYKSFGDEELPELVAALKKGDIKNEHVKMLLWHELADMQPISLSEMPLKYLQNPNGRTLYMLKTFTLKQMDIMRRDGFQMMKATKQITVNGKPVKVPDEAVRLQGYKNLLSYAGYFIAGGMGTSSVKDWMMGREWDASDEFVEQMWKLIGFNKYSADRLFRSGDIPEAVGSVVGVPTETYLNLLADGLASFDIYDDKNTLEILMSAWTGEEVEIDPTGKGIKSIPLGGKLYYQHYMGGKEKDEERAFERYQSPATLSERMFEAIGFAKGGLVFQINSLGFAKGGTVSQMQGLGFANGGEVSEHPRELASKQRNVNELLKKNSSVPFVDRINNPQNYPMPERNADDSISTHLLSAELDEDGVAWSFPNKVLNKEDNTYTTYENNFEALDIAKEQGNAIRFKTIGDAAFFSQNYKTKEFENYYHPKEKSLTFKGSGANIVDTAKIAGLSFSNILTELGTKKLIKTDWNTDPRIERASESKIKENTEAILELSKAVADRTPDNLSLTEQGFRAALESAPLTAVAMVASIFGTPALGLTIMGSYTGALEYSEAREKGKTFGESLAYGAVQGNIEAWTERLGLKPLMRMFKNKGAGFMKDAAAYATRELIGENAAEFGQSMTAWYAG